MSWYKVSRVFGAKATLLATTFAAFGFAANASAMVCLSASHEGSLAPETRVLSELIAAIREDLGKFPSLLEALDHEGPTICLSSSMITEKAYFDPGLNRIVLSDDMDEGMMRAVLVHELRHLEQFFRGICPSDKLAMQEYARATLALEADASAASLLVAWERREAGDDMLWQALASWDMTSDIAERFLSEMSTTHDISAAAAAAFDQWYASEIRQDLYYVASCSQYLDRQDEEHTLPTYGRLASDFLDLVCVLSDGSRYPCAARSEKAR